MSGVNLAYERLTMLRNISLLLAGALLAGCESTGVQGTTSYRDGIESNMAYHGSVIGNDQYTGQVAGERSYRPAADRTTVVERTRTTHSAAEPAAARTEVVAPSPNQPARNELGASGYPTGMTASNDLRATALIDRSDNSIRIANASDHDIRDAKVWIDGTYFARVSAIPARGTITVDRSSFANRSGNAPTQLKGVKEIQLQTGSELFNLQGPVQDDR